MIKSEILTVRITPETLKATKLVAAVTHRSVAGLVEHALTLYIQKNYPNAFNEGATLTLSLGEAP